MNTDIVNTDTQNRLTVPAGDLKPYPLSQNDKPADASSVEVPSQEPVVTDTESVVSNALESVSPTEEETTPSEPTVQLEEDNSVQEINQAKPLPEETEPAEQDDFYVKEDTPEEQVARKMGKGNKEEKVFFEPETGKNIITNKDDYDRARFEYLSGMLKSSYLKRTHNYSDLDENLYETGRSEIKTLGKMLGGTFVDAATAAGSAATVGGAVTAAATESLAERVKETYADSLKMTYLLNKKQMSDYDQGQLQKMLSNPIFGEMRANGASADDIKAAASQMYSCPVKYKNSESLENKATLLDSELRNPQASFAEHIENAKKAYSDFRKLNDTIRQKLSLNPDEYDNPTMVYWGNVVSSTVLCAAGAFAGGMGWLMPALYAAMEWDDAMAEGLQSGKSFEELLPKSMLVGAASMATERLRILSAIKRYKGMRQMAYKGLAAWAFENTAQEVVQDATIMGTKQLTGIAKYNTLDYVSMVPDTALAALVSSVPMGVIVQHNKIRLAKGYMASGMSEQRALTLADFVMEQGMDAVRENPVILKEFTDSLGDILKTSKVVFARHAMDESRAEIEENNKVEQQAYEYAETENNNGKLFGVLNTALEKAMAEPMVGYKSVAPGEEVNKAEQNRYGMGSLFTLSKDFSIKQYGQAIAEKLKRISSASVLTIQLPDRKQIAESDMPIRIQSEEIQKGFERVYNALPAESKKAIKSLEVFKGLTPNQIYNVVEGRLPNGTSGLTKILLDNGVKGMIVQATMPDSMSVIVFDDKNDAKLVKMAPIATGKQLLAQPFAGLTKEQLNNMPLEKFLELTKVSRMFKEPKNGKFEGLANPDFIVKKAKAQLEGTGLFSDQEADIIASQLVMLQYANGVMFGDGAASVNSIIETLPTFANTFMSSAFNRNGEYSDFWNMAVGPNSIFSYNRGRQTAVRNNEALIKKVFDGKTPTEEDLKEFALVVRKILTGGKYSGKLDKAYNFLSTELEKETVFGIENNPRLSTVLRTLVAFETRLQASSSKAHLNRSNSRSLQPVQYKYQGEEKDAHMADLAILRVFGMWHADKTDSSGFWNPNRDSKDLQSYYQNASEISVSNDVSLRELYEHSFGRQLPDGESSAWKITKDMIERGVGGYNRPGDAYDTIVQSFASRPATPLHEMGHEVLFVLQNVLNRYQTFAPQRAKRIISAFEKVYEKNYGEKINFFEPLTKEQEDKAHELFADLYSQSFVNGRVVDGDEDLNFGLKMVQKLHSVIRNPSVDQSFISTDSIKNEDAADAWQSVWQELNRKETAPQLLEARQSLLLGYDKVVGMNGTLEEGINEALETINKLPSSPTTMVAKYQLQRAQKTGDLGYVLQANATLVNGAVEEMFGARIVNQNLVDVMTKDSQRKSVESLVKMSCAVWEPLKQVLPENVVTAFEKMYVSGAKFYNEANEALARAIQEDGYVKSFANFARKALQPLSRTAKNLSPKLYNALYRAVFIENQVKAAFSIDSNKFFSVYDQMSETDQAAIDSALFDQDWRRVEDIFAGYGDINIVRGLSSALGAAYSMLEEADPDDTGIRITKDYFPRSVKQMDEMLQYMINKPQYRQMAEQIMQQKMLGEEAAKLLGDMYGAVGKVEKGKERHAMERSFITVPEDLRQFYATPREALQKYFEDVAAAYGNFMFFGPGANKKMRPDTKGEVTLDYVDTKTGKKEKMTFYAYEQSVNWAKNLEKSGFFKEAKTQADRDYNKKVAEVIEGVFFRKSPHPFVTVYRTVNNIATINNFFTAMSNLVDFAITTWRYGFRNTLEGAVIAAKGDSAIEYKELSADLYEEFDMDSYRLNRIFNKVFTWSGFSMLDIFGKQSSINAALGNARERLQNGDQEIIDKIALYMGDNQDATSATIADILDGRITDNVRFFAFNELSGQQPLTLLDVPYYYNLHPNMRVFYQFKTFMLRQADFFVHDVLMKKMQTAPLDALKDAVSFMALLALFGVPKELIKAMFMGQSFDLSDEVISQMLGVGLINKYSYYNFKDGHIVKGAGAMIIPPLPVLSRFGSDIKGLTIGKKVGKKGRKRISLKDIESIKDIPSIGPIGGEALYWWFGGGSNRHFGAEL